MTEAQQTVQLKQKYVSSISVKKERMENKINQLVVGADHQKLERIGS